MINQEFKSILELVTAFPTEQSCIDHLEALRWEGGVVSPFDETSKVYKCKDNRYRCKNTEKYFNVRTKTLFDNSKIALRKWFLAIWLVTSHKKGISSVQLGKDIHVTQKTAWFMLQRIRNCFDLNPTPLTDEVEIDETYVGGKNKNRHYNKKVKHSHGRSTKDKTPVLGMVQRGGKVIAKVVADVKAVTLTPYIVKHVKNAVVFTDEWHGYKYVKRMYQHEVVNHGAYEYVRGNVYTNTIENFWSILKRGIIGIYHVTSSKHLQKYVDEFCFRYNLRLNSQTERFNSLLLNSNHKLTYKELIRA